MKIIGITGARRAGKDTFYKILRKIDPSFERFSFADELKRDLFVLIHEQFGINVFDCEGEEKEFIRPLLITYGCMWRAKDPLHWVKKVDEAIEDGHEFQTHIRTYREDFNTCITDCRFPNEAQFFIDKYGDDFILIEIEREGGSDPTEEELKHIPDMKKLASFSLKLPSVDNVEELEPYIQNFLDQINTLSQDRLP